MTNLIIRSITKAEYETGAKQVWDACFPDDGAAFIDYYFEQRTRKENVLAAFDGDRMVADLHILPKKIRFGGVEKNIAFIAGVGTHPEYRMQGIAGTLLQAAEPIMLSQGYSAAMLHPFSFAFYQKFGYEPFANCSECVAEPAGADRCGGLFKPKAKQMLAVYCEYMQPYLGTFVRDMTDFELLLEEASLCGDLILADDTGYAWGREDKDSVELYEIVGREPVKLADRVSAYCGKPVSFRVPACDAGTNNPFNMIKILDESAFMRDISLPNKFWKIPKYAQMCFGLERY